MQTSHPKKEREVKDVINQWFNSLSVAQLYKIEINKQDKTTTQTRRIIKKTMMETVVMIYILN